MLDGNPITLVGVRGLGDALSSVLVEAGEGAERVEGGRVEGRVFEVGVRGTGVSELECVELEKRFRD
eukprot:3024925-Rhodomonas_salina.1